MNQEDNSEFLATQMRMKTSLRDAAHLFRKPGGGHYDTAIIDGVKWTFKEWLDAVGATTLSADEQVELRKELFAKLPAKEQEALRAIYAKGKSWPGGRSAKPIELRTIEDMQRIEAAAERRRRRYAPD